MLFTIINYMYVVFLGIAICARTINKDGKVICKEIPSAVLEEVLGAAYNARYMSIGDPIAEENTGGGKRRGTNSGGALDFYVDSDLGETIDEQPAWSVKSHVESVREMGITRYKREIDYLQEWNCRSRIKWTDLGPDYFPRYLRTVECLADRCWFDMYRCRPRSFAVKILKRRRDRCVAAAPGAGKVGVAGLPRDLRELWVWEERAVSFCCDCTM
ncbi:unnamed protein product [Phaedon cochleariae]|uniref:Uncharacterized protein n=1 Tax=Phaedon cochleariae TaxID=80249 RepID=A0A9P0DH80_PHACE|nr:unnamed protein product [Phaedon cochleariae]